MTRKKTWQECKKLVIVIAELHKDGSAKNAMKVARAARGWVYRWRKEDQEFHDAFEEARTCGIEVLIDEAHRRAYEGIEKPIYYLGDEIARLKQDSDTLLMFLIKQSDPTYREHFQIDHGNVGSRPFIFKMMLHPDAIKAQQEANRAK